ncbi:MAG: hypothetical protein J4N34_03495, partial [Chloroflexi bacterium]|nr:hypothetical protein [Chloroflexota bacterium]
GAEFQLTQTSADRTYPMDRRHGVSYRRAPRTRNPAYIRSGPGCANQVPRGPSAGSNGYLD